MQKYCGPISITRGKKAMISFLPCQQLQDQNSTPVFPSKRQCNHDKNDHDSSNYGNSSSPSNRSSVSNQQQQDTLSNTGDTTGTTDFLKGQFIVQLSAILVGLCALIQRSKDPQICISRNIQIQIY